MQVPTIMIQDYSGDPEVGQGAQADITVVTSKEKRRQRKEQKRKEKQKTNREKGKAEEEKRGDNKETVPQFFGSVASQSYADVYF